MTDDDAKQEAARRWGRLAIVRDRGSGSPGNPRFMVGILAYAGKHNVLVHGEGSSWEAAFAEADKRAEFLKPYMAQLKTLS